MVTRIFLFMVSIWLFFTKPSRSQICQDQPYYFNYKCAALKQFCDIPTAVRYKAACPDTCGLCLGGRGPLSGNVNARFQQPQPQARQQEKRRQQQFQPNQQQLDRLQRQQQFQPQQRQLHEFRPVPIQLQSQRQQQKIVPQQSPRQQQLQAQPQQQLQFQPQGQTEFSRPLPPELARRPEFFVPDRINSLPNSGVQRKQSLASNLINPGSGDLTNAAFIKNRISNNSPLHNNNNAFDRSRLEDARNFNIGGNPNHGHQNPTQTRRPEAPQRRSLSDAEAYGHVRQCCAAGGVKPECMHLCRYNTTKEEIVAHAVSGKCRMEDARVWMRCAANNRNNLSCCRRKNVIACDEYCLGGVSASFSRTLNCLSTALKQILDCHREGLGLGPPG